MQRAIDITVSAAVLLILSPLFLLLPLAIMASSPGGPFYCGWRSGKDGRRFRMWKFRTMVLNAAAIGPAITVKDDPRVTRLGWFLRNSKFDELPQLINVLLGDMTLVGPRPEDPEIVALYTERERAVLSVKPGLTGPVQLVSADESQTIPSGQLGRPYYVQHHMPQKLSQDLIYLRTRTAMTDARVLFRTVVLIVKRILGLLRHTPHST